MSEMDKYIIFKYLDEEIRIVGLPLDEFIPTAFFILFGLFSKFLLLGILLSAITVFIIKHFKKNRGGRAGLLAFLYWRGNDQIGKIIFPNFPSSTERSFL